MHEAGLGYLHDCQDTLNNIVSIVCMSSHIFLKYVTDTVHVGAKFVAER